LPKPDGAKPHGELQPENGLLLWQAAKAGRLHRVKYLLKTGADLEFRCSEGATTSLHQAAINGHKDILEALLEAGASVDAGDKSGATALHLASDGSVAIALIKAGADIDHEDCAGKTPVHGDLERQAMAATGAILTMSQQQSRTQRDVKSALQILTPHLPAQKMSDSASERWPEKSERDPRTSLEIRSWLNNHVQTPYLWLQGGNENGMGRSLIRICQEEQGSIVLRCECNRFNAYGGFLGPVTILREANYSALYQVLSHFDGQRVATSENFDLDPYYGFDNSPGKSLESMMRVQELIAGLLSHVECPVLWVIENYEVLENERLESDAGFRRVLHGFLKLAGGLRVPQQARNAYRCLFLARSRPAPSTRETLGSHMALSNTDDTFDRWM
jgi:hypothetical protein